MPPIISKLFKTGYDIGMKLEKSPNDFEILMGNFDGSMEKLNSHFNLGL